MNLKIIVVGGGAAGFFAALAAKSANPQAEVLLLERSAQFLSKVRVSGGGRCNVTHACFDPVTLVNFYPRGSKELLGPFHRFQPRDTVEWFESRSVLLKVEADGRMFPVTDDSETIIACLVNEAKKLGVVIETRAKVELVERVEKGFSVHLKGRPALVCDRLILATGSGPIGWQIAQNLGHIIQNPVPSLFTLNVPEFSLAPLAGISVPSATVRIDQTDFIQNGPLLLTHWGFSGPAALKLSAFGARWFSENGYQADLVVDWVADIHEEVLYHRLEQEKKASPTRHIGNCRSLDLPKRLFQELLKRATLAEDTPLQGLSKPAMRGLIHSFKHDVYKMQGKTTHKEEFVTCGGVTLQEIDFKKMESRCCPGLYFCGEILDIDGVTGGFNFQNAWTGGWLAGNAAALRDCTELNFTVIEEENGSDFENFSESGMNHTSEEKFPIDESIFPSRTVKVNSVRSLR